MKKAQLRKPLNGDSAFEDALRRHAPPIVAMKEVVDAINDTEIVDELDIIASLAGSQNGELMLETIQLLAQLRRSRTLHIYSQGGKVRVILQAELSGKTIVYLLGATGITGFLVKVLTGA